MNLKELEAKKLLKLPHATAWGGSFSGTDKFYSGNESQLKFVGASGGNSESDKSNVILQCTFKHNPVTSRIRDVSHRLDKNELIIELNKLVGRTISEIYSAQLANVFREDYLCRACKKNPATGPKIVGAVREGSNVKALKTLLMCDQCYENYKNGSLSLTDKPGP